MSDCWVVGKIKIYESSYPEISDEQFERVLEDSIVEGLQLGTVHKMGRFTDLLKEDEE